jgi:hypothetical protein
VTFTLNRKGVFMKKTQAINLTQKVFRFKNDNFVEHEGYKFYHWRKDELLQVLGVIELEPGKPCMCVGVGKELFDFEHIDLEEFETIVDTSRDFSTALATADRPQGVVVNFKA